MIHTYWASRYGKTWNSYADSPIFRKEFEMVSFANPIRRHLIWLMITILIQFASQRVGAQLTPERYQSIPRDSLAITSIDVASLRNRKDLELVPWEIISAFGKQELGIDPLLIKIETEQDYRTRKFFQKSSPFGFCF
ncbi:MAG TPA: hypothetical protein VM260_20000 [Pirellula sp.]|nr:hypothetical protein [Pirellula sp.]